MVRRISGYDFAFHLQQSFFVECICLQDRFGEQMEELYSDARVYPGRYVNLANSNEYVFMGSSVVLNPEAYYLRYVEWGTGIFMRPGWSPGDTERLHGNPGRGIHRQGKRTAPRGVGFDWEDLAGNPRKGWHTMIWKRGGKVFRMKSTKGQPGQHRLGDMAKSFLNKGALCEVATKALRKALMRTNYIVEGGS